MAVSKVTYSVETKFHVGDTVIVTRENINATGKIAEITSISNDGVYLRFDWYNYDTHFNYGEFEHRKVRNTKIARRMYHDRITEETEEWLSLR